MLECSIETSLTNNNIDKTHCFIYKLSSKVYKPSVAPNNNHIYTINKIVDKSYPIIDFVFYEHSILLLLKKIEFSNNEKPTILNCYN